MRYYRDVLWKAAKNSSYLEVNNLRFAEDLSPEDCDLRKQLWPLIDKARQQGLRAYYVGPKAFINGKEVTLSSLKSADK